MAAGREIRIIDLAEKIKRLVDDAGIQIVQKRKWDTKSRLSAPIDKVHALIGYEPRTTFNQGLSNTIEWFRQNWSEIEARILLPVREVAGR